MWWRRSLFSLLLLTVSPWTLATESVSEGAGQQTADPQQRPSPADTWWADSKPTVLYVLCFMFLAYFGVLVFRRQRTMAEFRDHREAVRVAREKQQEEALQASLQTRLETQAEEAVRLAERQAKLDDARRATAAMTTGGVVSSESALMSDAAVQAARDRQQEAVQVAQLRAREAAREAQARRDANQPSLRHRGALPPLPASAYSADRVLRAQQDVAYEMAMQRDAEAAQAAREALAAEEAAKEARAVMKAKCRSRLPEEWPEDDELAFPVVIRLPTNSRVTRRFRSSDSFQALIDWLEGVLDDETTMLDMEVVSSYPSRVLFPRPEGHADLDSVSFEQMELLSRSSLMLRRKLT